VDGTTAQLDLERLAPLATRLDTLVQGIGSARVVRHWACLRIFAPDRLPVIGPDPRLSGLYWLAGLGGFGMTVGVAAGEQLASTLGATSAPHAYAVGRLLGGA
jgi:D-arginine dehydrogenase